MVLSRCYTKEEEIRGGNKSKNKILIKKKKRWLVVQILEHPGKNVKNVLCLASFPLYQGLSK